MINTFALKLGGVVVAISLAIGCYFYIQNLHIRIEQAVDNQKKLESIVEAKSLIIDKIKDDFESMRKINNDLTEKFDIAQSDVDRLKKEFLDERGRIRDFSKLATQKPKELQSAINRGTKFALRCNEIATGSPLKIEDDNNTICPELIKSLKVGKK